MKSLQKPYPAWPAQESFDWSLTYLPTTRRTSAYSSRIKNNGGVRPTRIQPVLIIDIQKFSQYILNYHNRALISYITHKLKFSFRLEYTDTCRLNIMDNLSSLGLFPDTLSSFICNKMAIGCISDPFFLQHSPTKLFIINPLSLIEKRDTNPVEY
jgi:hypothetical protein